MFKIGVLVSGDGTTLDNLAFHCYDDFDGMVYGLIKIVCVTADRECNAREIAKKWNLPFRLVERSNFATTVDWSEELFNADVDLHVMGGFKSLVVVPERLERKILNIHPSFDAQFSGKGMYGIKVHEAVIASGAKFTGCTVHTVDNEYDKGEVVEQVRMGVLPWDTPESLQHSVQAMERRLYPRAILNYLKQLQ